MFGFKLVRADTVRSLEQALRDAATYRVKRWDEWHAKTVRANKGLQGEIDGVRAQLTDAKETVEHLQSDLLRVEAERDALSQAATDRDALRSTLFDIMSQETPSANATVRRMARMAREALGHDVRPKGAIGVTDDQLIDFGSWLPRVKAFLAGDLGLHAALSWANTPQGYEYWCDQQNRGKITPEARAIIEASVRRAEGKS